ncbi:MAG: hypothetical protein KDB01_19425 [Planctomycetaceae bacterium]|nr:hypothetical protein [Planctomycetaceae bacterium]
MSIQITVTDRDEELLKTLTTKVRLFSLRQISNLWWNGDLANSRRRLRQLIDAELLLSAQVLARPILQLDGPMISWRPGDVSPDCGQIANFCQSRIRRIPVRATGVFIATERTARLFGGRCRGELTHPAQATHDLGVAAIWIQLSQSCPKTAIAWLGEEMLAHTRVGQKCPDAFIVDDAGSVSSVIEFGGDYDRNRIQEFHEDCERRNLPYQLW